MSRTSEFQTFFLRDIDKFVAEINAFPDEESLWQLRGQIANCAGTLGLHIAGNLQHFIGALLGGSGYVRQRDLEFSARNVPRAEILTQLGAARQIVERVFSTLPDERLDEPFPDPHFGAGRSVAGGLLHLLAHLNYHLGQLNYLRRCMA